MLYAREKELTRDAAARRVKRLAAAYAGGIAKREAKQAVRFKAERRMDRERAAKRRNA